MHTYTTFTMASACDGLELSVMLMKPKGRIEAIVQLAHGMAEHKERYLKFMDFLAEHGIMSVIMDHRGHCLLYTSYFEWSRSGFNSCQSLDW